MNGLAQVPFEGVLIEAYKGTRRKYNMKFKQIGHTTRQYGQSFTLKLLVHGTCLLSLKLETEGSRLARICELALCRYSSKIRLIPLNILNTWIISQRLRLNYSEGNLSAFNRDSYGSSLI